MLTCFMAYTLWKGPSSCCQVDGTGESKHGRSTSSSSPSWFWVQRFWDWLWSTSLAGKNKQCHSEVLAQWFLALQKSSPWKRICLLSLSGNGRSLEQREGITQDYLIGPSFLKNSDPKSHWRDTYRITPNLTGLATISHFPCYHF